MHAQGLLFLSKTPPKAQRAADGTFGLLIYAYDRIANKQVEAWVVLYTGPRAEAFWADHREQLKPGTAIQITSQRLRSHTAARAPEIHATACEIEIAPARHAECNTAPA